MGDLVQYQIKIERKMNFNLPLLKEEKNFTVYRFVKHSDRLRGLILSGKET
jgi:hypothetical protein